MRQHGRPDSDGTTNQDANRKHDPSLAARLRPSLMLD